MKEIKFRVWNPRHKEFKFWGFLDNGFIGIPTGAGLTIQECKDSSQQYTGLKDKNGKECYFNDFVKLKNDDRIYQVVQDDFGIPLFTDFNAGMDINFSDYFIGMNRRANDFEIIGNIYEILNYWKAR